MPKRAFDDNDGLPPWVTADYSPKGMDLLFFVVNEEGFVYEQHLHFAGALPALEQFPNDTIVVAVEGSPAANKYKQMGF